MGGHEPLHEFNTIRNAAQSMAPNSFDLSMVINSSLGKWHGECVDGTARHGTLKYGENWLGPLWMEPGQ